MSLPVLLMVGVIFFAGQFVLCRKGETGLIRGIPVILLVVAAVAISLAYVINFGDMEQTNLLFGYTMQLLYVALSDGFAWLLHRVIEKAEERKNNF